MMDFGHMAGRACSMASGSGWGFPGFGGYGVNTIPRLIGSLMPLLFLTLVVIGIALIVRWALTSYRPATAHGVPAQPWTHETGLEVLKKRYASGDITRAEYEEKRKDLL
ncbi:MAG: SHOCT domain-containing protein [Actinomycetota bacterium]